MQQIQTQQLKTQSQKNQFIKNLTDLLSYLYDIKLANPNNQIYVIQIIGLLIAIFNQIFEEIGVIINNQLNNQGKNFITDGEQENLTFNQDIIDRIISKIITIQKYVNQNQKTKRYKKTFQRFTSIIIKTLNYNSIKNINNIIFTNFSNQYIPQRFIQSKTLIQLQNQQLKSNISQYLNNLFDNTLQINIQYSRYIIQSFHTFNDLNQTQNNLLPDHLKFIFNSIEKNKEFLQNLQNDLAQSNQFRINFQIDLKNNQQNLCQLSNKFQQVIKTIQQIKIAYSPQNIKYLQKQIQQFNKFKRQLKFYRQKMTINEKNNLQMVGKIQGLLDQLNKIKNDKNEKQFVNQLLTTIRQEITLQNQKIKNLIYTQNYNFIQADKQIQAQRLKKVKQIEDQITRIKRLMPIQDEEIQKVNDQLQQLQNRDSYLYSKIGLQNQQIQKTKTKLNSFELQFQKIKQKSEESFLEKLVEKPLQNYRKQQIELEKSLQKQINFQKQSNLTLSSKMDEFQSNMKQRQNKKKQQLKTIYQMIDEMKQQSKLKTIKLQQNIQLINQKIISEDSNNKQSITKLQKNYQKLKIQENSITEINKNLKRIEQNSISSYSTQKKNIQKTFDDIKLKLEELVNIYQMINQINKDLIKMKNTNLLQFNSLTQRMSNVNKEISTITKTIQSERQLRKTKNTQIFSKIKKVQTNTENIDKSISQIRKALPLLTPKQLNKTLKFLILIILQQQKSIERLQIEDQNKKQGISLIEIKIQKMQQQILQIQKKLSRMDQTSQQKFQRNLNNLFK